MEVGNPGRELHHGFRLRVYGALGISKWRWPSGRCGLAAQGGQNWKCKFVSHIHMGGNWSHGCNKIVSWEGGEKRRESGREPWGTHTYKKVPCLGIEGESEKLLGAARQVRGEPERYAVEVFLWENYEKQTGSICQLRCSGLQETETWFNWLKQ